MCLIILIERYIGNHDKPVKYWTTGTINPFLKLDGLLGVDIDK